MEKFYTCYSKEVFGIFHFFVKRFATFPELKDVPDVLEGYGMHTDFDKACAIAQIQDAAVKAELLRSVQAVKDARVIPMNMVKNIASGKA